MTILPELHWEAYNIVSVFAVIYCLIALVVFLEGDRTIKTGCVAISVIISLAVVPCGFLIFGSAVCCESWLMTILAYTPYSLVYFLCAVLVGSMLGLAVGGCFVQETKK